MQSVTENLIGNRDVLEFLKSVAHAPSLGHAYLFLGPDGVGKKLAALEFARAINCACDGGGKCESCKNMVTLGHSELLLIADANKPRWLKRSLVRTSLGLVGDDWRERYADTVEALFEKEYLEEPLPDIAGDNAVDGFSIVTSHLFGKGSVPSRECYTPGRVAESIRRAYEDGKMPEAEYRLLRLLYEFPISLMPYRGAIPIAYVTERQGWQFTRPIQPFLARCSLTEGRKVVVVDDAQKLSPQAQNCLLKTLEEPPDDSVIILVASDAESMFPTIRSRCQVVRFKRLTAAEMTGAMNSLLGGGGDRAGVIAALSGNCPGRALELSLLRIEEKLDGVQDLLDHLVEGRPERVFGFSRSVLGEGSMHRRKVRDSTKITLELLIFWLMGILRLKSGITDSPLPDRYISAMKKHAASFEEPHLLAMSEQIENVFSILPYNVDFSLLLDTTLLKLGVRS